MLNIPECVPKQLVEELEGYQKQLKILIRNFKVLQFVMKSRSLLMIVLHCASQFMILILLLQVLNDRHKECPEVMLNVVNACLQFVSYIFKLLAIQYMLLHIYKTTTTYILNMYNLHAYISVG